MVAQLAYPAMRFPQEERSVDFKGLFQILNQQKWLMMLIMSACLGAAIAYILTTKPLYTAQARILIDPLKAELFSDVRSTDDLRFTSAMIESQVEVIKSKALASAVLKSMGNADFIAAERNNDTAKQDEIIEDTLDGLTVSRVGETYVISVQFTSDSPKQASRYANAVADAYLTNEVKALQDVSGGALESMKVRLSELRKQMTDARLQVQKFRTENDLFEVDGRMISDEQLRNLNTELSNARNAVAAAKAQLEFSRKVVEEKNMSAAVAAAFDNDVINNIRAEYLTSKKKLAELQRTLGSSHEAVKRMRHEITEYERIVEDEMRRMMQNDANRLNVAQARANELEQEFNGLLERRAKVNAKKSELEGLENEAAVFEALYTSYLDKVQQTSQKITLPVTDSRIISVATPPTQKSHPKPLLILAAALVLGAGFSVVVGLYKGLTNDRINTVADAERMRLRVLGTFPMVCFTERRKSRRQVDKGEFRFDTPVFSASINDSLSQQADTVRRIRAVWDTLDDQTNQAGGDGRLLGVVSCHEDEGKSTLAANIALSLAKSGCSVLLMDGDLRRSKIVGSLFVESPPGFGNLLFDEVDDSVAIVTEARTGLSILTNVGKDAAETMTMYHKEKLKSILARLRSRFRYIIVDLPPLLDSSDVFILNNELDRYLMVVEAGRTTASEVTMALEKNEIPADAVLGVVLNKSRA